MKKIKFTHKETSFEHNVSNFCLLSYEKKVSVIWKVKKQISKFTDNDLSIIQACLSDCDDDVINENAMLITMLGKQCPIFEYVLAQVPFGDEDSRYIERFPKRKVILEELYGNFSFYHT